MHQLFDGFSPIPWCASGEWCKICLATSFILVLIRYCVLVYPMLLLYLELRLLVLCELSITTLLLNEYANLWRMGLYGGQTSLRTRLCFLCRLSMKRSSGSAIFSTVSLYVVVTIYRCSYYTALFPEIDYSISSSLVSYFTSAKLDKWGEILVSCLICL